MCDCLLRCENLNKLDLDLSYNSIDEKGIAYLGTGFINLKKLEKMNLKGKWKLVRNIIKQNGKYIYNTQFLSIKSIVLEY